jgi:hypothetical protein
MFNSSPTVFRSLLTISGILFEKITPRFSLAH